MLREFEFRDIYPGFIRLGMLGRPHGLSGEMHVLVFPKSGEAIKNIENGWIIAAHGPRQEKKVRQLRQIHEAMLIAFLDCETRESIMELSGRFLAVPSDSALGVPWDHMDHILGAHVVDENEQPQGMLSAIVETGANPIYVVRAPAKEQVVAAIPENILGFDPKARIMRLRFPEWI
jgi:16S rRNA processing protein RimM